MSDEVATLLAKKFIARQDVKAIQHSNGAWSPHTLTGKADGERVKWRMGDLRAHLAATSTFGHYMLDTDSKCKLFAFDIDLEKNSPADSPTPFTGTYLDENGQPVEFDAREAWRDRKHPSRTQTKIHLMLVAKALANIITTDLEIPTAVAYSGNKGLHVYGFTGHTSAKDAREGAEIVLESFGEFEPTRGNNFWRSKDQGRTNFLRNFTIEVFPKQDTIGEGGLGNLMRLPLGKNFEIPADPTFFIDPAAPDVLTNWTQMDAVFCPYDRLALEDRLMKKAIMTITLEIGVDLEEVEKLLGGVSSEVGMHMTNLFITRTDVNEAQFRRMSVDMVPFGGLPAASSNE